MATPEQGTGTANELFDLVNVLYHALEGDQTYGKYLDGAQPSGDRELQAFLSDVRRQNRERAERAKRLLARALGAQASAESGAMAGAALGETTGQVADRSPSGAPITVHGETQDPELGREFPL